MFTGAIFTALGIYLILLRMGIRKVLFFGASTDIVVSVGLAFLMAGTISGMLIAMVAGVILTALLILTRLFVKPEPPSVVKQARRFKLWKTTS